MSSQPPVNPYGFWYSPVSLPFDTDYREMVSEHLIHNLAKAINAEFNAIRAYESLAQLAPNEDFRTIIINIRNDEVAHFRNFSHIYSALTNGRQPQLTPQPLPTNFRDGVEKSIRDELEDSKFYQDTASLTTDHQILTILRDASADEARHATWFSYILNSSP